jgi:hypothetical protein
MYVITASPPRRLQSLSAIDFICCATWDGHSPSVTATRTGLAARLFDPDTSVSMDATQTANLLSMDLAPEKGEGLGCAHGARQL